jgi:hypothetical protein
VKKERWNVTVIKKCFGQIGNVLWEYCCLWSLTKVRKIKYTYSNRKHSHTHMYTCNLVQYTNIRAIQFLFLKSVSLICAVCDRRNTVRQQGIQAMAKLTFPLTLDNCAFSLGSWCLLLSFFLYLIKLLKSFKLTAPSSNRASPFMISLNICYCYAGYSL